MKSWNKPRIVISKCLNNNPCRYNGESANSKFIKKLIPYIDLIEICPEQSIGLTTPRNAIRLVEKKNKLILIDPKTYKEYTSLMVNFAEESYIGLKEKNPHGFLLKTKSPSCGLSDANVYSGIEKGAMSIRKDSGIYGSFIKTHFPLIPIEDDGRINNFSIRDQFLTKVFLLAYFEEIKFKNTISELINFHTKNKLLFMAYNQTLAKKMGTILANYGTINFENIIKLYEVELLKITSREVHYTSLINVFTHAYGYFSNMLRSDEKTFFFETLEKYRQGKCPHCVIINILKGYAIRFNNQYLLSQTILEPYPEDLIDFSDSGKGIVRN